MSEAAARPYPTPLQALGLTLGAGLLRAILMLAASGLGARPAIAGMATIAAYGVVLALAAGRLQESPAERFGFVPTSGFAWAAVPCLAASLILISEVENLLRPLVAQPPDLPGEDRDLAAWLELGLVLILVIPVCEEIFFRGLVQPGLAGNTSRRHAVLLTAFLNGLVWALPYAPALPAYALRFFVLYAGMGLVSSLLRAASGSIRPAIALAVLFGVASVLAAAEALQIPGFDAEGANTPLEWLAAAALVSGIGLGLCRIAARVQRSGSDV